MIDDETFLFANERFYAAFATGDVDAMEALWAETVPVLCVHPGAPPLCEREEIIASWRAILADTSVAEMRMDQPRLQRHDGLVLVVCYERLGGGVLAALNGFVLENGAPRMVLHQAGPCREAPPAPPSERRGGARPH